jgi:hypothetical protein
VTIINNPIQHVHGGYLLDEGSELARKGGHGSGGG